MRTTEIILRCLTWWRTDGAVVLHGLRLWSWLQHGEVNMGSTSHCSGLQYWEHLRTTYITYTAHTHTFTMFHNHSHTGIDICTICMHMPKFVCVEFSGWPQKYWVLWSLSLCDLHFAQESYLMPIIHWAETTPAYQKFQGRRGWTFPVAKWYLQTLLSLIPFPLWISPGSLLGPAPPCTSHGQELCDRLRDGQRPRGLSHRFTSDSTLARHHHCHLDSYGVYRGIRFQRSTEWHAQFRFAKFHWFNPNKMMAVSISK